MDDLDKKIAEIKDGLEYKKLIIQHRGPLDERRLRDLNLRITSLENQKKMLQQDAIASGYVEVKQGQVNANHGVLKAKVPEKIAVRSHPAPNAFTPAVVPQSRAMPMISLPPAAEIFRQSESLAQEKLLEQMRTARASMPIAQQRAMAPLPAAPLPQRTKVQSASQTRVGKPVPRNVGVMKPIAKPGAKHTPANIHPQYAPRENFQNNNTNDILDDIPDDILDISQVDSMQDDLDNLPIEDLSILLNETT